MSGTVDNGVAKAMFVGMKQADAQDALNGQPLHSAPYYRGTKPSDVCEYYRGVSLHGISYAEATGTVWRLCFRSGKLVVREPVCPVPWKPGEVSRYKQNNYRGEPYDCKL